VGMISCFLPCREMMMTSTSLMVPDVKVEEGFPYGVSTSSSCASLRSSGFSSPDPPIMPILTMVLVWVEGLNMFAWT